MKLQGITSVQYSIKEDLQDIQTDRLINELSEDVADTVASWYILNESTNKYEINELLVNEGIKDIISKGIGKVNDAITKGYSDIDAIKTKVIQGLKSKGDPGVLSKLGEIAKKNAKYIKPALMVAVVGASLLGMDTASASETINQVGQMQPNEFQQYADQLNQQFQDSNAKDAGDFQDFKSNKTGAFQELDNETKGGQQAQAPQEAQPKSYGPDTQPNATNDAQTGGAEAGANVDTSAQEARLKKIVNRALTSTNVNGQNATPQDVQGWAQSFDYKGAGLDEFIKKVADSQVKNNLPDDKVLAYVQKMVQQHVNKQLGF